MTGTLRIFRTVESPAGVFEYRWSLIWLLCRSAVIAAKRMHPRSKLPTWFVRWCGRRAVRRRIDGGRWLTLWTDDSGRVIEVA